MFISKSPLRISFFGGSTDYKDFYSQYGSLLVGTTIDKFAFTGLRYRPRFLDRQTYVAYSNYDIVDDVEDIKNPLIRETLKYYNIFQHIDLITFNDIPSRTGLGGSSSFCVSLIHSIYRLLNKPVNIGNDDEISINKLASKIIKLNKSKSKIKYSNALVNEPRKRKPDLKLIKTLIKWSPEVNLQNGLIKTTNYFKK